MAQACAEAVTRVIVPFTRRLPEVEAALPDAEWIDVSSDDEAYWRLLRDIWAERQSVVIVEHDIIPAPGAVESLKSCMREWCACPYPFEAVEALVGLGCTKFGSTLMYRLPDLIERVGRMGSGVHPPRHWCSLDGLVQSKLVEAQVHVHRHEPAAHLSTVRSHEGCR